MLRVEIRDSADTLILKLEGRFTGADTEHIRTLTTRLATCEKLLVDLTEVIFVDSMGEEALSFLGRFGAEFVAPNSYLLDVCERLSLPVAENSSSRQSALENPSTNGDQSRSNVAKPPKT